MDKKTALKEISVASSYGNLGLFIGSGFSKAVLNSANNKIALSWGELLKETAKALLPDENNYNFIDEKRFFDYPKIASKLCKEYSETKKVSYEEAQREFKNVIAEKTAWYPNEEAQNKYAEYIKLLDPAWIITTNYDLVIEALLPAKSVSLGPNDSFTAKKGLIPVYHLHGKRTNPEELIITQEDYVSLFRPNQYRQQMLSLKIKESTVLFLGYALGDVNVLTALDWSQNVYNKVETKHPHKVIQILKTENPEKEAYTNNSNIAIIETKELGDFFDEFKDIRNKDIKNDQLYKLATLNFINAICDSNHRSIYDVERRKILIAILSKPEFDFDLQKIRNHFDECVNELKQKSLELGNFEHYNTTLNLILDILTGIKTPTEQPALLQIFAHHLDDVGPSIGDFLGQSYSAKRTWDNRNQELTPELVKELKLIADQHQYLNLKSLLEDIK